MPGTTVAPTVWLIVPPFEYATVGPRSDVFKKTLGTTPGCHCPENPPLFQPGMTSMLYWQPATVPQPPVLVRPPAGSVSNDGFTTLIVFALMVDEKRTPQADTTH